jgi:hypothetical protein
LTRALVELVGRFSKIKTVFAFHEDLDKFEREDGGWLGDETPPDMNHTGFYMYCAYSPKISENELKWARFQAKILTGKLAENDYRIFTGTDDSNLQNQINCGWTHNNACLVEIIIDYSMK